MLVKDVEKRCHISKQTLFYYEKEGLIKPDRNENRYRDYSDEDVERIELIIKLRAMDMSIATIKKIFNQLREYTFVLTPFIYPSGINF